MRALVVFYSYEGNTKLIAEHIAKEVGADFMEIRAVEEKVKKGFMKYFWGGRQVVTGKKPPIVPPSKDWRAYDIIFIGFPIWAYSVAAPMVTYLDENRITGKKVAVFASFEGNAGKAFEMVRKELIPDNTFLGEEAFFAPLMKEREGTLKKSKDWARGIFNKIGQ